ncbi:hypothetical protein H8E77_24570 [bacterium]|nr:hypothetical protein [bacterium]
MPTCPRRRKAGGRQVGTGRCNAQAEGRQGKTEGTVASFAKQSEERSNLNAAKQSKPVN